MGKRFVHLVIPATAPSPLAATTRADLAFAIARAILGVDVVTVEVLDRIPESIKDDLAAQSARNPDFGDDVTPVDQPPVRPVHARFDTSETIVVDFEEID